MAVPKSPASIQSAVDTTADSVPQASQRESEKLLTTKHAARFLGVSEAFLERDRWAGARIPFYRIGSRAVRYRLSDLNAYVDQQKRNNTADLGGAQ